MHRRKIQKSPGTLLGGVLLPLLLVLGGCGAASNGTPPIVVPTSSYLAGSWLLAGSLPSAGLTLRETAFGFAASFDVNGAAIGGAAKIDEVCSPGLSLGTSFTGAEADDGSFTLTSSAFGSAAGLVTLTGHVPSAPGAGWTGSYTITNPVNSACPGVVTGSVQAIPLPLPQGTYTAQATATLRGAMPQPVSVQLEVQQSSTPDSLNPGASLLLGTLQLKGLSCLQSGSTVTGQTPLGEPAKSLFQANLATAYFGMNDGSTLLMQTATSALDGSQLTGSFYTLVQGSCPSLEAMPVVLMRQ